MYFVYDRLLPYSPWFPIPNLEQGIFLCNPGISSVSSSRQVACLAHLLDLGLALEVLAGDELRDVVVIGLLALLALLHALVALGQLAQRGKGVWAKLVQDAGDELGQLLVLAITIDGESVCGDSGVNCLYTRSVS